MQSKTEMRRFYRARRDAISDVERAAAQNTIIATLTRVLAREQRRRIALYLAVRGEANVDELLRVLARRGTLFAAPISYSLPPLFGNFNTIHNVVSDQSGARFPPKDTWMISPVAFDAIIVPGIAFDESGNRLGQGGGWYDRVLAEAPHALKIGVAFECQMAPQLPRESHDVEMDLIVTEKRCVDIKSAVE